MERILYLFYCISSFCLQPLQGNFDKSNSIEISMRLFKVFIEYFIIFFTSSKKFSSFSFERNYYNHMALYSVSVKLPFRLQIYRKQIRCLFTCWLYTDFCSHVKEYFNKWDDYLSMPKSDISSFRYIYFLSKCKISF